jgi:hypothetical protein
MIPLSWFSGVLGDLEGEVNSLRFTKIFQWKMRDEEKPELKDLVSLSLDVNNPMDK